jgi:hypothetical protein
MKLTYINLFNETLPFYRCWTCDTTRDSLTEMEISEEILLPKVKESKVKKIKIKNTKIQADSWNHRKLY